MGQKNNNSNELPGWVTGLMFLCIVVFPIGYSLMKDTSKSGIRYITVSVLTNPSGAQVDAMIDNKMSGRFSPGSLGTTPTGQMTMHFAFGATGVRDTKLGVRIIKKGFKIHEIFFTREECYTSEAEAGNNVKLVEVQLTPR